jgi:phosphohistidine phosphatase
VKIYVVRHGPAEDTATSGKDFDRALTPSGRERVREVARALGKIGEEPKVILSSPLVRALQTAEVIAAELAIAQVETTRDLAPAGDAAALFRSLVMQKRKRAMIVGHQPDLTILVETVTEERFPYDMTKAMVVGLRAEEGERATLRFVLDPKTLELHKHE